jgi:GNAT superfamily N-acetyltransferase
LLQACAPAAPAPPPSALVAWQPHSELRGITLPPKNPLEPRDYQALDIIRPGSVVVFSAQLGDGDPLRWIGSDPFLQRWLETHQDVTQVVRMWPVRGPEDPRRLALRIVRLHQRFPWITWFQVANEPDIEWPREHAQWDEINTWSEDVWWQVEWYRQYLPSAADIKLLFPPLAQDSPLDPERVGYDALRPTIELYLDHGDGLAGHEYWDKGNVFLVEQRWPAWLQARLAASPFFVTESGRRLGLGNSPPDAALGDELVDFAARTLATVVTPFVLSSPGGSFDQFDFVDREGNLRAPLFVWSTRGP